MDISLIIKTVGLICAFVVGVFSPFVYKKITKKDLMPDNTIEELAEEMINQYSGIDIDFTPETPEKGKNANK